MDAGEFIRGRLARWRSPDGARLTERLMALSYQEYDNVEAGATGPGIERLAERICVYWRDKGADGYRRLLLEYRKYAYRAGRDAERCYTGVLTKLGVKDEVSSEVSPPTDEQRCRVDTAILICAIQGANDRGFLNQIPDIVSQWEAIA